MSAPDPFATLGVTPSATDAELRAAYRHLVQLHHPDHNHGSAESTRRFTEVQEAYAQIKLRRTQHATAQAPSAASGDPGVEARLAAMEQELKQASERRRRAAQEAEQQAARARESARRAAAAAGERASDAELGYVTSDDSFSKIFDDLADQVTTRLREHGTYAAGDASSAPGKSPATGEGTKRPRALSDWIDELGSKLTGDKP